MRTCVRVRVCVGVRVRMQMCTCLYAVIAVIGVVNVVVVAAAAAPPPSAARFGAARAGGDTRSVKNSEQRATIAGLHSYHVAPQN